MIYFAAYCIAFTISFWGTMIIKTREQLNELDPEWVLMNLILLPTVFPAALWIWRNIVPTLGQH